MHFFIGASRHYKFSFFGSAIKWYMGENYSHIYSRYICPFTGQDIISESSKGEAHKILKSKWRVENCREVEFALDCSEEMFRAIICRINARLQASYSERNIIGVLIYDLYEYTGFKPFEWFSRLFKDGNHATICSESASFTLALFGVRFKRPLDFVRPDHVVKELLKLSKSEDYITRVI